MKKQLSILAAMLFIVTSILQAETKTLASMKSLTSQVVIKAHWTPFNAEVKANGQRLENGDRTVVYINYGQDVIITTEDNIAFTELDLSYNELIELNVENNVDLMKLNCSNNPLESLIVKNNISLGELRCNNSLLRELDLENNFALKQLYCNYNLLTQLNLADNINLTHLDCSNNKLTQLNLWNNSDLTHLDCSNNLLTQLSFANNSNLVYMDCKNNLLTQLNMGNNSDLTFLNANDNKLTQLNIENCIALIQMLCSNNQLTQLNVENSPALVILYCDTNQLTQLNVENNPDLVYLLCRNNQLTQLNVENNLALEYLLCNDNRLTQLNVENNTALEYLYCHNNQLSQLNVENNTALVQLRASGQQIEIPLFEEATSFPNPIYYKTFAGENTVYIDTEWYTYGEDVPKTGTIMTFTTNLPAGVNGYVFSGIITLATVYNVTFESNGGTAVEPQIIKEGNTVAEPVNPTKDKHTFEAWYADENLTTAWDFQTDVVTSDVTLYAKWQINDVSINKTEILSLNIYPNPTTDIVRIANANPMETISLYTINGQQIRTNIGTEIDLSGLPNGVYILQVENKRATVIKK